MATLVFTAVGTALGGPLGGAIGSLLGQSLDQQFFGSAARGPRLGDLNVQTSTYGTRIPRIYGTMRVAGSVIWATDLEESSTQTGAKGQPDTTVYSYSVSFAVALSSRRATSVKRIWADGKLLRGAAGDFKVSTGFRFYDGSEDQQIDPLIGSIEGVSDTPAYRGISFAIFENLELAEYGNRIPFLTFEIEADPMAPTLGALLTDASQGSIQCNSTTIVEGYAAHGANIRSAVEPLIEHFGIDLFDDGSTLRSPAASPVSVIPDEDLGNSIGMDRAAPMERTQIAAVSLPAALTLAYYDAARDYQTSQMRGSIGEANSRHEGIELPIVMQAGVAKALVESGLARRWARRDQLTLRLPPKYMAFQPGSIVGLASPPSFWAVEQSRVEGMVVIVELRPAWRSAAVIAGDAGRSVSTADLTHSETRLALFDLPDMGVDQALSPALYLAATASSPGWRPVPVEISAGGLVTSAQTAARQTILGNALSPLPPGQPHLLDLVNQVQIELADENHWLESCDDEALVQGANLAAIGSELVQFGFAEPVGPGRFQISRLLRGRRGTEWAMDVHATGEAFALIQPGGLRRLDFPSSLQGVLAEIRAKGLADTNLSSVSGLVGNEGLRPPCPVHLKASRTADGGLQISWARRSRAGWAWLDEMDSPIGEARELYQVTLEGPGGRLEANIAEPSLFVEASQLAAVGEGDATLSVRQLGDRAISRAATLSITLN